MKTIRIDKIPATLKNTLFKNKVFLVSLAALLIFPFASTLFLPQPARALGETGWEKLGATPIIPLGATGAWDAAAAGEPSVIKDGTTFKMWYSGQDANGAFRIGLATSSNGTTWTKHTGNPVLATGASGSWDAVGVASPSVIKDGANSYKMWYTGRDASDVGRIGLATSTDGIAWTKHVSNPVLNTSGAGGNFELNSVGAPTVILDGTTFMMWYTGKNGTDILGTLSIGLATSPDGITWTKQGNNPVMIRGTPSSWEARGVGVAAVIKDGTVFKMWYTGYASTPVTTSKIGFASSANGINWTKNANNPILTTGASTTFEGRGVGGAAVMNDSGSFKMWYSGIDSNLAASTGFASIPSFTATTAAVQFQNPTTLIIGINHRISSTSSTGQTQTPGGGIASFAATATYIGAGINVLSGSGQAPFTLDAPSINNSGGTTNYSGSQTGSTPQAPLDVATLVVRLIGDKNTTLSMTLHFDSVTSGDGLPVTEAAVAVLSGIQRGDAQANGNVNIVDALFIAQYLAQIRPLTDLNPISAASIRYDGAGGDRIGIQDAMFIAQMLAGLRDASYNLI